MQHSPESVRERYLGSNNQGRAACASAGGKVPLTCDVRTRLHLAPP